MDLTSSQAFICRRSNVLSLDNDDVVPIGKVGADSQWNGLSAYIGVTLSCKRCHCEFPFSAGEQKTWREEYGFSIHCYPVHCRPCRVIVREITVARKRLYSVLSKNVFDQSDFDELIDVVYELIKQGATDVIGYKLKQKIYWAAKRSVHSQKDEVVKTLKNENH